MEAMIAPALAAQPELVLAMGDPGFYPHEPAGVELRETHISWVFLAGERAYKLKKPLRLAFLDYSTPERRRAMCQAEVRLNRRLAPEVYLGVKAIVRRDGELRLAPEQADHAVDYVVEMRRYDERRTLAALTERGELSPAQIEAVARRLVRFHAEATRVDAAEAAVARPRRALQSTLEDLYGLAEHEVPPEELAQCERFAASTFAARRAELYSRLRAGLVRDCHGDLRLEHVLVDGSVAAVDCLEFDPALRETDVAADLSFLVMELEAHGEGAHADALIAAYEAAGGDPGERSLLAFFAFARALVRAKVAFLRAGQLSEPEAAARARREGRDLIRLARRLRWRSRSPLALVVCGPPASGKSHLAERIASDSGWARIASDQVRKRLAGVDPQTPVGPSRYAKALTGRTYQELARLARERLERDGGVVVDATFRRAEERARLRRALGPADALFLECSVPEAELARRAAQRARRPSESDAGPEIALRLAREFEPLDEVPATAHLMVRTDAPLPGLLALLEAWLDDRAVGQPPSATGLRRKRARQLSEQKP